MLKYKLTAGYYVQLFQYDNKGLVKMLNKGNTLLYELDTIKNTILSVNSLSLRFTR